MEDEIEQTEAALKLTPKHRHSILNKSSRRSTFLLQPQKPSEPPIDNPFNSHQVNQQLKSEYESIKSINQALEGVIEDFEEATDKIHLFSENVSQTYKLLNIWAQILEKTQDINSVLEDNNWKLNSRKRPANE
ncbi:hypothetical protein INT46_008595 [Mucor plumbeus]|jgi:hypothetical protein|uniref:DASH complex subunit DUO1 n=1 Tax=Mucor plumbeus TaxID=97098 RepID=A0A8H7V6M7_9FUNG|nr:hypothetical protein INT46_008595 [Mucor plumbeus]